MQLSSCSARHPIALSIASIFMLTSVSPLGCASEYPSARPEEVDGAIIVPATAGTVGRFGITKWSVDSQRTSVSALSADGSVRRTLSVRTEPDGVEISYATERVLIRVSGELVTHTAPPSELILAFVRDVSSSEAADNLPGAGDVGVQVQALSSCTDACEANFRTCVALAGIFAVFVLPVCFAQRDSCNGGCIEITTPWQSWP